MLSSNLSDLENNKRNHKVDITDIAISKFPLIKYYGIPKEHYKTLQVLSMMVLEFSRRDNNCNETAITYSLDNPASYELDRNYVAITYGDEHSVNPFASTDAFHLLHTAAACVLIVLHNHPSLSKISLQDVAFLIKHHSVKMIVAITNLGSINYIVKTDKYDRDQSILSLKKAVDRYNSVNTLKEKQDATDMFLYNCYKTGLHYADH